MDSSETDFVLIYQFFTVSTSKKWPEIQPTGKNIPALKRKPIEFDILAD